MSTGSFKELKDSISAALVDTTRATGQITNEDLVFHRTLNPSVSPLLERQSSRLLNLARDLTRVASSGTEVAAPKLSNADSIDDDWRGIVDVLDNLLEKADACLDEYTGVIKRLSPSQEEQIRKAASAQGKQKPSKVFRSQDIPKPQSQFANAPSNHDINPFKPLLKSKPHAIVPLEESLQIVEAEDGTKQYDPQDPGTKTCLTSIWAILISDLDTSSLTRPRSTLPEPRQTFLSRPNLSVLCP